MRCAATKCPNSTCNKSKKDGITFHSFPKDPKRKKEWLDAIGKPHLKASDNCVICSDHFEERCFDKTGQVTRIRQGSIPTIFSFSSPAQKASDHLHKKRGRKKKTVEEDEEYEEDDEDDDEEEEEVGKTPERLPSKRKIKPKLMDDEIIEWGPKRKRILVRRVTGEPQKAGSGKAGRVIKKVDKRPQEDENEVPSKRNFSPAKQKKLVESQGKKKNGHVGGLKTTCPKPSGSSGFIKKEPPLVTIKTEIESEEEELDDDWSQEEELEEVASTTVQLESSQESPDIDNETDSESSDDEAQPNKGRGANCFAYTCNNLRNRNSKGDGITFHKFPHKDKSPERYAAWIKPCRRDKEPTQHSLLCSRHFKDALFDRTGQTVRLKPGAVPTIFHELTQELNESETQSNGNIWQKDKNSAKAIGPPKRDRIIQLPNNRMYFEFAQPKSKVILHVKPPADSVEMRTGTLAELLNSLKMKHLLSRNAEELLETFRNLPKTLIRKQLEKQKAHIPPNYSQEVMKFATMLYVNSSQAYDLVSQEFMLPERKMMREKLLSEGYWPGFTKEAMRLLKNGSASQNVEQCSIMIDFITLKKKCDFDEMDKRWVGHVDFCSGPDPSDSDALPTASEILMFTAVGLVSEWKMPFGYFPVNGISGEALHNLVNVAITILEECNLKVRVLVCDGTPQNIKMGMLFGCKMQSNFREIVTSFPHPLDSQRKIHFVFGISHSLAMLKFLLAEKTILRSTIYGLVKWEYFHKLMNKELSLPLEKSEESEELKGAILEFQSLRAVIGHCKSSFNVMINRAFELAGDLELKEFEDSEPTANLLADVYRAFDMLNSRNPVTTGEKPPITNPYVAEQLEAMTVIGQRIYGLENFIGVPIAAEGRWISILLFPFILKSVSIIASELIHKELFRYFTTYRINLDHSELIIRRIQKCGGWKDTPTAAEFQNGYKIFFESCVNPSPIQTFFNDYDGDDLTVGQGVLCPFRRQLSAPEMVELDGVASSQYLTEYNTDVILMARYVIRNLSQKLSCPECVALLINHFEKNSQYTMAYDYVRPSRFIKAVLKISEKQLKMKLHESNASSLEHLVVNCFYDCLDLFRESYHTFYDHISEEPHHVLCLTKSIIRTYLNYKLSTTTWLSSAKTQILNIAR